MADGIALFRVAYEGEALANHEMDVKELAPALLAIGELFEEVNRALNPVNVKMVVNMRATKEGSVEVYLSAAQSLIEQAKTLFSSDNANAVVNAATIVGLVWGGTKVAKNGVVGLIKRIKGRKIKDVKKLEFGNIQLILEDGEIIATNHKEISIFELLNVRQKLETIIFKPLSKHGITEVKITTEDNQQIVEKEEAEYFIAPLIEERQLEESVARMSLQLVNVSFGDYKWKFFDGSSTFNADIEDQNFLNKVRKNDIAFAKDDIFVADVKTRQSLVNGNLKLERVVINVVEYKSAASYRIRLPGME